MRPDVVLMHGAQIDHLFALSRRRPGTLFLDIGASRLARAGIVVKTTKIAHRVCLALTARPGFVISTEEMINLLFSDREDGGPETANKRVSEAWTCARRALTALGYRCETIWGRGYVVDPDERRDAA